MTYTTIENTVDGSGIVGKWPSKAEAIAQAQRLQAKAGKHRNPWGAYYSVRRTYEHFPRSDRVYQVGGKAVA